MCLKPGWRQLSTLAGMKGRRRALLSMVAKLVNWQPGPARDQFSPFEGKANETVCVQDSHRDLKHSIMNINNNMVL